MQAFGHFFEKKAIYRVLSGRQDELDKDPTVRSRWGRGDIAGSTGKGRLSGGLPGGCRMASDLMDDAFGMSGYNPDAMDKVIQADGLTVW